MIDWNAFAKVNGLSVEEFKKEIYSAAACCAAMEIDNEESVDGVRFTCSDNKGMIQLFVRRIKAD